VAQARTPCDAESVSPDTANGAQVSDAVFCLTNQIRASFGLPVIRRVGQLDAAAVGHSRDMATRGFFDHTNPDGKGPGDRARAQGYTKGVGENIAYGYSTARTVMVGWMGSDGHCRNILSSARDIGVGTVVSSTMRPYYTQDFGDYFSASVDAAPANGCPYQNLDLDALTVPAGGPGDVGNDGQTTDAPQAGPLLSGLALSPRRLRRGRAGRVSLTLSADATVTFRIERATAGRRVAGACVRATRANRRAGRCTRYVAIGRAFTRDGVAGANSFRLSPRASGSTLRAAIYRLRATAASELGSSSAHRAGFMVTRR
jgi:hypothetical protein